MPSNWQDFIQGAIRSLAAINLTTVRPLVPYQLPVTPEEILLMRNRHPILFILIFPMPIAMNMVNRHCPKMPLGNWKDWLPMKGLIILQRYCWKVSQVLPAAFYIRMIT